MKNKKMLLIAGVLAAFLMLAVPFAVASVDSEDSYGAEPQYKVVTTSSDLKSELEKSGDTYVKLGANIITQNTSSDEPFVKIITSGIKVLDLNGFTITDSSQRFMVVTDGDNDPKTANMTGIDVKIMGPGTIDTVRIFKLDYLYGCSLEVTGGTYVSDYSGFLCYGLNNGENNTGLDIKITGATINAAEGQSDTGEAAVWVSNKLSNKLTISDTDITAGDRGIFCGVIKSAILDNVDVDADGVAVEIKSGEVRIDGGTYSSSSYIMKEKTVKNSDEKTIRSTIIINNRYLTEAGVSTTSVIINGAAISNEESESKPVIVASGTSNGTVSLNWDGHDTEILAFYVPNVVGIKDVYVNGYLMVDNYAGMTSALDAEVKKIGLTNDIKLSESSKKDQAFTINYGVEINGFGHSIETNGYERIFKVSVHNKEVSFINLNASCNNGIQYPRVINIIDSVNASIDIINCTFVAGHYAVNITQNNTGTEIDVNNSYIRGYAAFNIWSSSEIVIKNSEILGLNSYPKYDADNKPLFNDFAAITIYGEKSGVENSTVNLTIEDSKLEARAAQDAYEFVIDYRDGTGGLLKLKDVSITGYGKSYSMYLGDADVEFNGTVTIVDDSAEELYLGGNTYLNGIIVDEGKGSITANVTGKGYVTGSNVAAWASTGAQELDSDSATVGPGQSVTDINSSSNTVIIQTPSSNTAVLDDSLTVNVQDDGKEMSVELPAGSQISDNALVHMSQVGYSADGNKQFEITLSGIDNAGMDIYITIPRENNGLDAKVFWIKDDGSRVLMDNLSDGNTSVTFITTHNSLYELVYVSSGNSAPGFTPGIGTVTEEAFEGFSTADYATMAGIVIAVVMLIGLVCIVRRN